jgi:hypothetical protein
MWHNLPLGLLLAANKYVCNPHDSSAGLNGAGGGLIQTTGQFYLHEVDGIFFDGFE